MEYKNMKYNGMKNKTQYDVVVNLIDGRISVDIIKPGLTVMVRAFDKSDYPTIITYVHEKRKKKNEITQQENA